MAGSATRLRLRLAPWYGILLALWGVALLAALAGTGSLEGLRNLLLSVLLSPYALPVAVVALATLLLLPFGLIRIVSEG